jgi:lipoprotein-anchoring transpeptidase ErfK/SrfK
LTAAALAGCTPALGQGNDSTDAGDDPSSEAVTESAAQLRVNVPQNGAVQVDKLVTLSAEDGALTQVTVKTATGNSVSGTMSHQDTVWTAAERLEPATTYRVKGVAVDANGLAKELNRTFTTVDLTLAQQTYPSISPQAKNGPVGVGMPVIVRFDVAVTDRAEIEKHLKVDSTPAQVGSWHWISDNEVHWRPKTYWKADTDVTVTADINGVNAGNGIYGQENRVSHFHVGDAVILRTNLVTHQMRVFQNGRLLRTLPVTGGDSTHLTRSGIKVIIEKYRSKRMDAATTGVSTSDPDYYNIANVEYAQRVTYSGEFMHAAPWSVGSQGYANVSHGCVGMSTSNAAWLYGVTKPGDVVAVTGTNRPMEETNGYGDWNLPWSSYKAGSAL